MTACIKDNQFWWVVVSALLVMIGTMLPFAGEQLDNSGMANDLYKYGGIACSVVGFIGLIISVCAGGDSTGWAMGVIGGIMLLGVAVTTSLACTSGTLPGWCGWLMIPALVGLVLLGLTAARSGNPWYSVIAVLFIAGGYSMMKFQRDNSLVDGLGLPLIGMGWIFFAMSASANNK